MTMEQVPPTPSKPVTIGNTTFYADRIRFLNDFEHPYSDVVAVNWYHYYNYIFLRKKRFSINVSLKYPVEKLSVIDADTRKEDLPALATMCDFISERTFANRLAVYQWQLDRFGCFVYGDMIFTCAGSILFDEYAVPADAANVDADKRIVSLFRLQNGRMVEFGIERDYDVLVHCRRLIGGRKLETVDLKGLLNVISALLIAFVLTDIFLSGGRYLGEDYRALHFLSHCMHVGFSVVSVRGSTSWQELRGTGKVDRKRCAG